MTTRTPSFCVAGCASGVLYLAISMSAGSARVSDARPKPTTDDRRVPLAVAKDRAKLAHGIYAATLDAIHHRYFRREQAVLPARAMEDVFAEVDRETGMKSRWVAVNTPAMSVNHAPETAFEKAAADDIAAGKRFVETVEDGYYRRAGAIPLGNGCVGCHTKFAATADKTPRFAGLVISVPVQDE
ncbi:MAG: DUF3365 domain-containing protein [Gemmataceae bacterium]|nr:DUF3365 domain-containing protein [Gemmataceae bacterium]